MKVQCIKDYAIDHEVVLKEGEFYDSILRNLHTVDIFIEDTMVTVTDTGAFHEYFNIIEFNLGDLAELAKTIVDVKEFDYVFTANRGFWAFYDRGEKATDKDVAITGHREGVDVSISTRRLKRESWKDFWKEESVY